MCHVIHVLAIPGSLRRASHTTALLQMAAELAPDGVEITLYDGLADVPPYDQDLDLDAVVFSGSTRSRSTNTAALRAAQEALCPGCAGTLG